MSEENVALMREGLAALNARDESAIAALTGGDFEWRPAVTAGGALEGTVYRGERGMVDYWEALDTDFDDTRFEIEAFEAVGERHVLYHGRVTARGRASGVPLEVPIWGLWEIREGRFVRGLAFLSEAEALEAVSRVRSSPAPDAGSR